MKILTACNILNKFVYGVDVLADKIVKWNCVRFNETGLNIQKIMVNPFQPHLEYLKILCALDLFFSQTTFYWSWCLVTGTKILRKLSRICLTQTHLSMASSLHDGFRSPFGLLFNWIKLRKDFKILSKRVQRSQDKNIYYVAEMGGSSCLEKTVTKMGINCQIKCYIITGYSLGWKQKTPLYKW